MRLPGSYTEHARIFRRIACPACQHCDRVHRV